MSLARGATVIAVLAIALPAIAQQPRGDAAQPSNPPLSAGPQVDESALRHFATQGDMRRVHAEIARLRMLYPHWAPPGDLSQLSSGPGTKDPQLDRLWILYSEGRIAEMRAAIADRQSSDAQWKVPPELLAALDAAEAQRRLVNASDIGQWRTVLSVATEAPSLLTCANVDVLWRVAEAFARTDQKDRARDVYGYVLANCANPAERVGTLRKALDLLSEEQVTDLLQFERRGSDQDDFGPVRDELARRRVARAVTDGAQTASADDLAVVQRLARQGSEPGTSLLLAWYEYHRENFEKALDSFGTALDRKGGPKAAEGYALSLRALGRFVEAEAFAYEWHDRSPENLKIYLDVATALLSRDPPLRLDQSVIARAVALVSAQRFADGAQASGWYAYNTGQFRTARDWFRTALSWKADSEPAAYGLAISSQRLNEHADFAAVVATWKGRSQRIAGLARPTSAEQVVGRTVIPSEGKRDCSMTSSPRTLSADAALSRGWCLMELDRPLEAVAAFDQAMKGGAARVREEAAYGKALAYLRKDLTTRAADAVTQSPQTARRRIELNATILAQRALTAYRSGRYKETLQTLDERDRIVPEPNDLKLIRGWTYLKLGRYAEAERIFRAVRESGLSKEADVGLNAVSETLRPSRY